MRKVKELPVQLDTQDICDWEWAKHGLSQSPTRHTHKSLKILIPDYCICYNVFQGVRPSAANVGHVHGVCMLSYCTSYQQLVKMSFQNRVPICNDIKKIIQVSLVISL